MSYQMEPIYRCAMCGRTEPSAAWQPVPFGYRLLPEGWCGSERKHGVCYCERCAKAVRELMIADGIEVRP